MIEPLTDYVNVDTARLLRKVDFDEETLVCWTRDIDQDENYNPVYHATFHWEANSFKRNWNSDLYSLNSNREVLIRFSAPTLYVVLRWLIKKFNIFVEVQARELPQMRFAFILAQPNVNPYLDGYNSDDDEYDSYEEALAAGIDFALNRILDKKAEEKIKNE